MAWVSTLAGQPPSLGDDDLEKFAEMSLDELLGVDIEVASPGNPRPIAEAPAVASVITAEQIEAMGATHLDEVLETVPGLHVLRSQVRPDPIYSLRGIGSQTNAQVLTLIDGVPIASGATGGPFFTFRMPVSHVARIEVIRGPGSALYGADAFAGVINIITKTAGDLEGHSSGLRWGSFDTFGLWFEGTSSAGGWDLTYGVEVQESAGDADRIITVDQQSGLDLLFGTQASRAPGSLATDFTVIDAHLKAEKDEWTLGLWSWMLNDGGTFAGPAQALDPDGHFDSLHLLADIRHDTGDRYADWQFQSRLSFLYLDQVQDGDLTIFPAGAVVPIGGDGNVDFSPFANPVFFPDGLIGNPSFFENTTSVELNAIFKGSERHRLRFGAGFIRQFFDATQTQNYGPGVIDGSEFVVDGTLTNITDTEFVTLEDQTRDVAYALVEDDWQLSPQLQLMVGVRVDDYSDFGSTVNPRAVLVWTAHEALTAKALYGSAFRAPSFVELFVRNNPVNLGNPRLDPETLDTYELSLTYQPPNTGFRLTSSLFSYDIDDLIALVPDPGATTRTHQNADQQEGQGLELEADWQVNRDLRLFGSAYWLDSEDSRTGDSVADVPERLLYLGLHYRMNAAWGLHSSAHWVADRARGLGDPRPAIDDYTWVDLTLRYRRPEARWGLGLSIRNLFDTDAREPSTPATPNDYPLEGRSVAIELRHRF